MKNKFFVNFFGGFFVVSDEVLYVKMILDAQIMEKEMKWSEMCILCEFVKVSVFFLIFILI